MRLTSNQVFYALLALSFISAFWIPTRYTDVARGQFEGLYTPVSWPLHRIGMALRRRLVNETPTDTRASQDIVQENFVLRQQLLELRSQLASLKMLQEERESLGDLMNLCDRFVVTGTDSGSRDGLTLGGALLGRLKVGQAVIHNRDLIGRVDRAGAGGAHVRLVTDVDFTITARFERFTQAGYDADFENKTTTIHPIIKGVGHGGMSITHLPVTMVQQYIQIGDWLVLQDNSWPTDAQNLRLGSVINIQQRAKYPLLAEINLSPQSGLMELNDVWVMVRSRQPD